jgi:hypothetical protein
MLNIKNKSIEWDKLKDKKIKTTKLKIILWHTGHFVFP